IAENLEASPSGRTAGPLGRAVGRGPPRAFLPRAAAETRATGGVPHEERTCAAAASKTGPHSGNPGDRDVPLRPPTEARPQTAHVAVRQFRVHDQTAEPRLAGADRLRQDRI